jgi:hypothetical protein
MPVKEAVAAEAVLQGAPIVKLAETTNAGNKTELPKPTLSNASCLDAPAIKKKYERISNTRDKTEPLEQIPSNFSYQDTPAMNKEWDKRSTSIFTQLCKDGESTYSRKFWETTSKTLEISMYKFF